MRKLYTQAAIGVCGSLVAFIAVPIQAKERINQAHYYFFSPAKFARLIQSEGIIRSLRIDGVSMNFTDKNHTGKRPSWNSKMIWAGFGLPPEEFDIVVDRIKFDQQQKQNGRKPSTVLIESALRPDVPASEFDRQKNLG